MAIGDIIRETSMLEFKELSRSVKGLTVLVTGAASGMGRATAHAFADEGANVAVTDLTAEGTRAVADAITASGGKAKAWALDVADPKAIVSVVNDIAAHFGSLDIIINNAGLSLRAAIDGERTRQAGDAALGRGIGAVGRGRAERLGGGDIDDARAFRLAQVG